MASALPKQADHWLELNASRDDEYDCDVPGNTARPDALNPAPHV